MASTTLDFASLRSTVDLAGIITAAWGPPAKIVGGKPFWVCQFHPDSNPSLNVFDNGQRWGCLSCGARGDVVDFLSRVEGIDLAEAARRLAGGSSPTVRRGASPASMPTNSPGRRENASEGQPGASGGRLAAWQNPAWQSAIDRIVTDAEDRLWSLPGRQALAWLRSRGLKDFTLRNHRLGFLDAPWTSTGPIEGFTGDDGELVEVRLPRGIVLPWCHPNSWYGSSGDDENPGPRWIGLNVRRLAVDPRSPLPDGVGKTQCAKGSVRGHCYPSGDLMPNVPTLICEGEIDALTAIQEIGHVVNVVTVGSTTSMPTPEALASLEVSPHWLLAFDRDKAGRSATAAWFARFSDRVVTTILPDDDDVNEFVMAGGDLAGWLRSEFKRLGLDWLLRV